MESFGHRLHELLEQHKISYYHLAKDLNLSDRTVSNWLKDRATLPRADVFLKICHYFMVEPEWLLGDEGVKKPGLSERMLTLARKLQEYWNRKPTDCEKIIFFIETWLGGMAVDTAIPAKASRGKRKTRRSTTVQGV